MLPLLPRHPVLTRVDGHFHGGPALRGSLEARVAAFEFGETSQESLATGWALHFKGLLALAVGVQVDI